MTLRLDAASNGNAWRSIARYGSAEAQLDPRLQFSILAQPRSISFCLVFSISRPTLEYLSDFIDYLRIAPLKLLLFFGTYCLLRAALRLKDPLPIGPSSIGNIIVSATKKVIHIHPLLAIGRTTFAGSYTRTLDGSTRPECCARTARPSIY